MTRGHFASSIGPSIQLYLNAFHIPRKAVCAHMGMHPSSLSRKISGKEGLQETEILEIGIAIGEIRSQSQSVRRA